MLTPADAFPPVESEIRPFSHKVPSQRRHRSVTSSVCWLAGASCSLALNGNSEFCFKFSTFAKTLQPLLVRAIRTSHRLTH